MSTHLRFVSILALLAFGASAQVQFADLAKRHLPHDYDWTSAVAVGDVDGDGAPDLVWGSHEQNRLYLGDGRGKFSDATAGRLPTVSELTFAVWLGDVDGDGDLDLVCGNGRQNRLYLNNGTGAFTDATATQLPVDDDNTRAVALADVDGDGDPDLVCGNAGQNRLFLNDGNGTFADATALGHMPIDNDRTAAVALGDVDGDGDLDLVCGNDDFPSLQNRLYLNDGGGTFTDATATRLPVDFDMTHAVALVDVEGDGDLDLLCGNSAYEDWSGFPDSPNRLYVNDGSGTFADAMASRLPVDNDRTVGLAVGDVDADGDLDLVCANEEQHRLYLNEAGAFTDATATHLPAQHSGSGAVALGDVDGDRDLDLISEDGRQGRLYLNDGTGAFVDATAVRLPAGAPRAITLGDVNSDGAVDVVSGNEIYLNEGLGTFARAARLTLPRPLAEAAAVVLGDVDGDGDLDLVLGNKETRSQYQGVANQLFLNDGAGAFSDVTATHLPGVPGPYPVEPNTYAVALGDVDGDGDLDLVFGNGPPRQDLGWAPGPNKLYLNDGSGRFAEASLPPDDYNDARAVALGDVDDDGDLDLVVGNQNWALSGGAQNRLYMNDGTGTFTDETQSRMPVDSDHTSALAPADVDGDGDLDLVFGNDDRLATEQGRLYVNDGAGTFTDVTASRLPVGSDYISALVLADVDGDDDLDLVCVTERYGGQNRLYLNDASGWFTEVTATRLPNHGERTAGVAVGDVDLDGDADLLFGHDGAHRLLLNLQRQLDVPYLVQPGYPYRLDVYARYAPVQTTDTAVVMLSAGTTRIPFPPFGIFVLDPTVLFALPAFAIPQPAGVASTAPFVPNIPGLIGLTIYAQAFVVQDPVGAVLTNGTGDRVAQ